MKLTTSTRSVEDDLNQAKNTIDCFLKGCSHDLKGPITSIQGLLEIARYYSKNDDIDNCLTMIQACASNLNAMVASLQVCLLEPHGN
jgi:K+-sensing histidine kinase KdpD